MASRTIAIGDVHGDLRALLTLLRRLPRLTSSDSLVFLGDYLDRGPDSAGVIRHIKDVLPRQTPARIVALCGNHEDGWLRVIEDGWDGFVIPAGNGTHNCLRSFKGLPMGAELTPDDFEALFAGSFFPPDVVEWMKSLPLWHEDEHAIYVHAGLPRTEDGTWLHPSEAPDPHELLWTRTREFFTDYLGKAVVVGHTGTTTLPQEHSQYTPGDNTDVYWAGRSAYAIDTGCGKEGGFLSAIELPDFQVYESR